MSELVMGTHVVNLDEPCLALLELNLPTPDSKSIDRYQIIQVWRGEGPAEFRRDLGPAKKFKADQFQIPGGGKDPRTGRFHIEHKVGELVEIADHLREGPYEPPEMPERHDLVQAFYDQPEIRRRQRKKVSSFGYGGIVQRS